MLLNDVKLNNHVSCDKKEMCRFWDALYELFQRFSFGMVARE